MINPKPRISYSELKAAYPECTPSFLKGSDLKKITDICLGAMTVGAYMVVTTPLFSRYIRFLPVLTRGLRQFFSTHGIPRPKPDSCSLILAFSGMAAMSAGAGAIMAWEIPEYLSGYLLQKNALLIRKRIQQKLLAQKEDELSIKTTNLDNNQTCVFQAQKARVASELRLLDKIKSNPDYFPGLLKDPLYSEQKTQMLKYTGTISNEFLKQVILEELFDDSEPNGICLGQSLMVAKYIFDNGADSINNQAIHLQGHYSEVKTLLLQKIQYPRLYSTSRGIAEDICKTLGDLLNIPSKNLSYEHQSFWSHSNEWCSENIYAILNENREKIICLSLNGLRGSKGVGHAICLGNFPEKIFISL